MLESYNYSSIFMRIVNENLIEPSHLCLNSKYVVSLVALISSDLVCFVDCCFKLHLGSSTSSYPNIIKHKLHI